MLGGAAFGEEPELQRARCHVIDVAGGLEPVGERPGLGKRLFGVSDDKPVMITVVDTEHKIREVLPEIRGMVKEGLVVLLDAEVVESMDAAAQ